MIFVSLYALKLNFLMKKFINASKMRLNLLQTFAFKHE